jgi:hypothetical protein
MFEEVAEAILQGFKKAWSITPEVVNMIGEEMKLPANNALSKP